MDIQQGHKYELEDGKIVKVKNLERDIKSVSSDGEMGTDIVVEYITTGHADENKGVAVPSEKSAGLDEFIDQVVKEVSQES